MFPSSKSKNKATKINIPEIIVRLNIKQIKIPNAINMFKVVTKFGFLKNLQINGRNKYDKYCIAKPDKPRS
jgi:hypothetical protein